MTVIEWLQSARHRLSNAGIESAGIESQLLAAHVLMVERSWLLAHPNEEFPILAGDSLIERRLKDEPLAYILGWREFYGRRFAVNSSVLIPRHETETLVEVALEHLATKKDDSRYLLDLCTGSGIVGITLKLECAELNVTASDISESALEMSQRNAKALNAEIRFVQSDRFAQLGSERFDAIVSNPPYIGTSEQLPPEVIDYEPNIALFSGATGLEFYDAISIEADRHLTPTGFLALEVGYRQATHVVKLFTERNWLHAETRQDLSGTPRIVVFKRS